LKKLSPVAVMAAEATASCWDSRSVRRNHELRSARWPVLAPATVGREVLT